MDDEHKTFTNNFKTYQFLLHRIIGKYIRDKETIKDLLQMTMLRAWMHRNDFKGLSKYSTWLCRIAINTTLNYIIANKNKPLTCSIDYALVQETESGENIICKSVDEILIADEALRRLHHAINALPAHFKSVLVLQTIYGLSYEQIAVVVNIPIGTVRSRIYYAKKILARELE